MYKSMLQNILAESDGFLNKMTMLQFQQPTCYVSRFCLSKWNIDKPYNSFGSQLVM